MSRIMKINLISKLERLKPLSTFFNKKQTLHCQEIIRYKGEKSFPITKLKFFNQNQERGYDYVINSPQRRSYVLFPSLVIFLIRIIIMCPTFSYLLVYEHLRQHCPQYHYTHLLDKHYPQQHNTHLNKDTKHHSMDRIIETCAKKESTHIHTKKRSNKIHIICDALIMMKPRFPRSIFFFLFVLVFHGLNTLSGPSPYFQ